MTTDLSNFAARLRERIASEGRVARVPALPDKIEDSVSPSSLWLDSAFNALALELFALQFEHNPACRRFCEARRVTPLTASGWRQLPAVPAAAFKELDLTCLPPAARSCVFHSSGTTGQRPSRHYHSPESLAVYEASLLNWFKPHAGDARELLILTPPAAQVPHSSLAHMFETIRRHMDQPEAVFVGRATGDGAWTLDFEMAWLRGQQAVAARRPLLVLGTAFSFVHLMDELARRDQRWQLPAGSAALETGGYKGRSRCLPKPGLHALIADRLGIPTARILCEYGMSELSSQAYDLGLDAPRIAQDFPRSFQFPPWARAQIVSPETGQEVAEGETGLLRIFDLANVFSVLALQTEDLAIRRRSGFELIGRAPLAEPRGCSLMTA